MATVAIVGAGIAGLTVARELSRSHRVTVFEKSRGFGGRLATRRAGPFQFDHGAQYITAETNSFRRFLGRLADGGVIENWPARFVEWRQGGITVRQQWDDDHPHYVGVPGMNAIGKNLAADLDVRLETPVRSLTRDDGRWLLFGDAPAPLGEFDWVISATPAAQTANLFASSPLATHARSVRMHACFALLLGFSESNAPDMPWQAARVHDADISWISTDSSKPGRPTGPSVVVHSTNAWANAHLDDNQEVAQEHLAGQYFKVTGIDASTATFTSLHRWRYANVDRQCGDPCALDADQRLAVCGDWFVRGRVESAFNSAMALADRLLREWR